MTREAVGPPDHPATGAGAPRARADVWAAVFFLGLTAVHTWPLARVIFDETTRHNDTLMSAWALRELTHQLVSDPLHLLDGNAFHPYSGNTLALVDHMFANALLVAPFWLLTGDTTFIYNIALLSAFALSGFCTYKLVAGLSGSQAAGLVAGVAFAFSTGRWQQLVHLHAASTQWLPLALLMLHRFSANPTRHRLAAFAGAAMLVAWSSWHVALFGMFAIGLVALWTVAAQRGRPGRQLWMLASAGLVVFAGLIPFALAYSSAARAWKPVYTQSERLHELQSHSLTVEALAAADKQTLAPYAGVLSRLGQGEWRGFPGFVTTALALVSLLVLRRGPRTPTSYRMLLAAISVAAGVLAVGVVMARRGEPAVAQALARVNPVMALTLAIAVAGLWRARTAGRALPGEDPGDVRIRVATLAYAAVVILGALLSLGPVIHAGGVSLGSGIYREDWLPMLSILRTPGRFVMLVALGAAVLAGLGVRVALAATPPRARILAVAAILVLLNLEIAAAPLDLVPAPRAGRAAHAWLRRLPEPGSVIEFPLSGSLAWMYLSPEHGRPLVNGSGYVRPPFFDALTKPPDFSRRQLAILWEHFHPRFAVVRGGFYRHKPEALATLLESAAAQPGVIVERARFGEDRIFELTDNGAGPMLYRRWPRQALARAGALRFNAAVSGSAPGTISVLRVDLNGRRLLHLEGGATERLAWRAAPYERDWIVPHINTFEIRGDYRLADDTPPRPVGTTGARIRADVSVESTEPRSIVRVNERLLRGNKGYTLVVLDEAGDVRAVETFNTSWYREESQRLAQFVRGIPAGTPVVVASEFDVSRALTEDAVAALRTLGLTEDLRGRFNMQHAAIGVKGAAAGTAVEAAGANSATAAIGHPQERTVELKGVELQ